MNGESIILGLENEFTLGVVSPEKRPLVPAFLVHLVAELGKTVPSVACDELVGLAPGRMLVNGARIYPDGLRLECATPEVRTPKELIAYQRANELLLLPAAAQAARHVGLAEGEVRFSRIVTDYGVPQPKYCGAHLNVLMRRSTQEELIESLVPFLISRFYTLAGGWGPGGFVMSQKAPAYRCVASPDTREQRGIVAINKNEPLASPPFKRLHLTHGDALMSELGTYLTVGCTALVCKMWDDGVCVGPAFALEDPLQAVRQLDRDPTWARPVLRLRCGRLASGLEIQWHFLTAAERYVARGDGEPWEQEMLTQWRISLEKLAKGPEHLATSLDPYIKLAFYSRILAERGVTLEEFGKWCDTLTLIEPYLNKDAPLPARKVERHLAGCVPRWTFDCLKERLGGSVSQWERLPVMHSLVQTMKRLDLRYHDVAEDGLYWRLRRQGLANSTIVTEEEIAQAMLLPPKDTRAHARGAAIVEAWPEAAARANWMKVTSARGTLDLSNPFATEGQWTGAPQPEPKKTP
jgi:hypothetical protein